MDLPMAIDLVYRNGIWCNLFEIVPSKKLNVCDRAVSFPTVSIIMLGRSRVSAVTVAFYFVSQWFIQKICSFVLIYKILKIASLINFNLYIVETHWLELAGAIANIST